MPGYRRPVARPSTTTPGSRYFHTDWNSRLTTPRTFEYTPNRPSQTLPSATDEISCFPLPVKVQNENLVLFVDFDTLGNSYSEPPRAGVDAESKLWEYYNNVARVADKDMLKRWQDDMTALLISAGLFSGGVVTVFLIKFYTTLQPDYEKISILQQQLISVNLQALFNATAGAPAYPIFDTTDALSNFRVPRSALWIQGLWFSALVCGISVASLASLVKSWLLDYVKSMNSGSTYDRAHRRQHRHDALLSWHVPAIIASLPVLMQLTVVLFLIGLVILMWQLNHVIGCIMLSMVILLAIYWINMAASLLAIMSIQKCGLAPSFGDASFICSKAE
ncbi:uncharacterized protein BT62DRAFT_886394 [Guyanagaster necrorhizus]|uniref:DUF6535 domain-containing protein n=1 Tax=Guyanagaster necrorhizus TaxID=856835 RepID=A0A9P7VZN9_9AGAR|nr:uncharacterized protein BT62DRAFT_886394 [Guyanagaster necrorhizus MCA 3950]KAG7449904.1 hypothetical protein BT62DRAFT_886394 [Guyanagaster necrorhizus MCA 3950]